MLINPACTPPASSTHGFPGKVRIAHPAGKRIWKPWLASVKTGPSGSGGLVMRACAGLVAGGRGVDDVAEAAADFAAGLVAGSGLALGLAATSRLAGSAVGAASGFFLNVVAAARCGVRSLN